MKSSDEIWAEIQQKVAALQVEAEKHGLYHRGYRFWPPYACSRCGEPISAHQFAFARHCGGCDLGTSHTARFSIYEHRWFVLGKAELEDPSDSHLIHPEFVPAHTRREYSVLAPPRPRQPFKPKPPLPKLGAPRRFRGAH